VGRRQRHCGPVQTRDRVAIAALLAHGPLVCGGGGGRPRRGRPPATQTSHGPPVPVAVRSVSDVRHSHVVDAPCVLTAGGRASYGHVRDARTRAFRTRPPPARSARPWSSARGRHRPACARVHGHPHRRRAQRLRSRRCARGDGRRV
jgi:hypothetical protein